MSEKKVKRLRQELRIKGISISSEPYIINKGIVKASQGRKYYQQLKAKQ